MALQNKNRKFSSKKKVWFAVLAVVVLIGLAAGAIYLRHRNASNNSAQSASTKLENKIDKKVTDAKGSSSNTAKSGSQAPATKQSTGDGQTGTTGSTSSSNVTPAIPYFGKNSDGQVEVDAFIPNITESGTCTLTITSGSTTIATQTKPAHPNAQSTNCESFFVDGSGASSSWRAVVSYSSSTHNGSSQSTAFQSN